MGVSAVECAESVSPTSFWLVWVCWLVMLTGFLIQTWRLHRRDRW